MLIAAACSLGPATSAQAADEARTERSLQCFVANLAIVGQGGANASPNSAAVIAAMFFAGQALGSDPDLDLAAGMRREALRLTPARLASLNEECGAEMAARAQQIHQAARAMDAP